RRYAVAADWPRRLLRTAFRQCGDHHHRFRYPGETLPQAGRAMSVEMGEEQLLELQRQAALGRLLADVAHEFSAPIGSILSNREVEMRLLERIEQAVAEPAPERAKELLSSCRELARVDRAAGERISRLLRSLKTA